MDDVVTKVAQLNPKDLLGYRTKLGVSLDLTYSLFNQVIKDAIESNCAVLNKSLALQPAALSLSGMLASGLQAKNTPAGSTFSSRTSSPSTTSAIDQSEFITCTVCKRPIHFAKYAPHLEKCLGMGRVAARAAANKRNVDMEDEEFEVMLDKMEQEIANTGGTGATGNGTGKRKKTAAQSGSKPNKTVTIRPVEDKDLFDTSFIDFDF